VNKQLRKIFLFVLVGIWGLFFLFVSNYHVLSAPNSVITVGSAAGCDYHSLKTAVINANSGDIIKVEAGTINEGTILISKNLMIDGGYVPGGSCLKNTISGQTTIQLNFPLANRIIGIENAKVTIKNFVVSGNTSGGGIKVFQSGDLTLENVQVTGNHAPSGGGILVENANLTCNDCVIDHNQATSGNGGGLRINGDTATSHVMLSNIEIQNNTASGDGGGMSIEKDARVETSGEITIGGNWSYVNHADGNGGGIAIVGVPGKQAYLSVETTQDSGFSVVDNEANKNGGGIYVLQGSLILNGVIGTCGGKMVNFDGNIADKDGDNAGDGGAIYAKDAYVYLEKMEALYNEAVNGAGVYCFDCELSGIDLDIGRNDASGGGGGFFIDETSVASVTRGRITANTADNAGGGGAYVQKGSRFELVSSDVLFNSTSLGFGGGISGYYTDTEIIIQDSQVSTNTAASKGGGLAFSTAVSVTIDNTYIYGNDLTSGFIEQGGGISAEQDVNLNVVRSFIYSNSAGTNGGGIYLSESRLDANRVANFVNTAGNYGGGIYALDSHVNLSSNLIVSNEADEDGGGIYATGTSTENDLQIVDSMLQENISNLSSGGGIYFENGRLNVERSMFYFNWSKKDGGGLYAIGGCDPADVTLTNNVFSENTSSTLVASSAEVPDASGGVSIYFEYVDANLKHNTINKITSSGTTFAISVDNGANVELTNNIIGNFYVGIMMPTGSTGSASADYTLFYGNTQNYDTTVTSTHEIANGNPGFVDTFDFHLTQSSDAVDAGIDAGVTEDLDGNPRPFGSAPDIGAYELGYWVYLPIVLR